MEETGNRKPNYPSFESISPNAKSAKAESKSTRASPKHDDDKFADFANATFAAARASASPQKSTTSFVGPTQAGSTAFALVAAPPIERPMSLRRHSHEPVEKE